MSPALTSRSESLRFCRYLCSWSRQFHNAAWGNEGWENDRSFFFLSTDTGMDRGLWYTLNLYCHLKTICRPISAFAFLNFEFSIQWLARGDYSDRPAACGAFWFQFEAQNQKLHSVQISLAGGGMFGVKKFSWPTLCLLARKAEKCLCVFVHTFLSGLKNERVARVRL